MHEEHCHHLPDNVREFLLSCRVICIDAQHTQRVREQVLDLLGLPEHQGKTREEIDELLRVISLQAQKAKYVRRKKEDLQLRDEIQYMIEKPCTVNGRPGIVSGITKRGRATVRFTDGKKPMTLNSLHPTSVKLTPDGETQEDGVTQEDEARQEAAQQPARLVSDVPLEEFSEEVRAFLRENPILHPGQSPDLGNTNS